MWLLALQSFLFCLHRLTGTTEVHDDTANIFVHNGSWFVHFLFFLKQPETFLVSVYISGRPDGRTLLGDIRSGVYLRAA